MKNFFAGVFFVLCLLLTSCGSTSSNAKGSYEGSYITYVGAEGPLTLEVYRTDTDLLSTLTFKDSSFQGVCQTGGSLMSCDFFSDDTELEFRGSLRGGEWSGTWTYDDTDYNSFGGTFAVSRQ